MARSIAPRRVDPALLPEWILPQLTQLVDAAPDGDQWLHEIKHDGYRMHAWLDRGTLKLLTRTGLDWTHKYSAVARAATALDARQAYLVRVPVERDHGFRWKMITQSGGSWPFGPTGP